MSQPDHELAERMRMRADEDRLAPDHELRRLADDLDRAVKGFFATPQTVPVAKLVGTWAKARGTWCAHTGEALL